MKKELISVIIPFYNRDKQLKTAVNSVLNQAYDNFEIILINDGSEKIDKKIIDEIKKDKKIKYYEYKKNMGPSFARNYGIKQAKGNYVAFLDSDDEFLENKLEVQYKFMKENNLDFSHTSYIRKSDKNQETRNTGKINENYTSSIIYNCGIATPTVMIKKSILNDENLYNTTLKIGEDVCFYLKLFKNCKMKGLDIPLSVVNVSDTSASQNYSKQLEGIKNILSFVLNDEYYKTFDREIFELFKTYESLLLKLKVINKRDLKFYFMSIIYFFARIIKKISPEFYDKVKKMIKRDK